MLRIFTFPEPCHTRVNFAMKLSVPGMLSIIIQRCIELFKYFFNDTDDAPNFYLYIQKFPENGPKAQQCTICGKSFSDNSSAQKHVENIHFPDSFVYTCRFCSEQFTKKNSMYKHISKFHKS